MIREKKFEFRSSGHNGTLKYKNEALYKVAANVENSCKDEGVSVFYEMVLDQRFFTDHRIFQTPVLLNESFCTANT